MTERSVVVMSGSTRAASTNTAFARTVAAHPPAGATVTAWTALTGLPHFDPELDRDPLPAPVAALCDLLSGANAVVFCTPEYAGALPGAFKNALEVLTLTDSGRIAHGRAAAGVATVRSAVRAALPGESYAALLRLLADLVDGLDGTSKSH